jgi:hypothetical protein
VNGLTYSLFGRITAMELGWKPAELADTGWAAVGVGRLPRARPVPRLEPNAPKDGGVAVSVGVAAGAADVPPNVVGSDMTVVSLGLVKARSPQSAEAGASAATKHE